MPHVSAAGGDDLGSTDEVKVFKDEGNDEDEKRSSENLTEEKSSLIDLTESEEKSGRSFPTSNKNAQRPDHSPVFGNIFIPGKLEPHTSSFNMGYLMSPYGYANGAAGPIPVSMAGKMGLGGPGGHMAAAAAFFCNGAAAAAAAAAGGDHLAQPPPAHMGIPPYQLPDGSKPPTGHMGLTRPPMYPFSAGQYPYPMLSPDMSQVATWHTPSVYPSAAALAAAGGFRAAAAYPSAALPISTADLYRFSPTAGLMHPGLSPHHPPPPPHSASQPHHLGGGQPAIITPGPKQEVHGDLNHRGHDYFRQLDHKNNIDVKNGPDEKKKPHIKKPLNAFMLYMKEMRAKVVAECTLKESAAINQILGRRWHALGREEQAKYYELARRERQLHMQLYPDWSSRASATRGKKRKRKQDPNNPAAAAPDGGNSMKKCRARYGLDQQSQWCKPCRRKKRCIRYMESGGSSNGGSLSHRLPGNGDHSDDNLGSCGSAGEAHTPPEDDSESLVGHTLSSPGSLSALTSLTSPSTSAASPSVSAASPYMLQSPLTPHELAPPPPPPRLPVGTNPRDANNPLSVNQLTGGRSDTKDTPTRSIISVT